MKYSTKKMTKMNENKIKFFVRFLKERNAYDKYRHNLFLNKGCNYKTFLKMFMNGGLISNAFSWRDTKEGFDYWEKLYDEFVEKYCEKFIQK